MDFKDRIQTDYRYKLSIITVNLNNRKGLQKTIDSVITQTFKNFEWIIIDGGSTDGSKELIEEYQSHISYWVSEPDKGIYNAMNKGILVSHGKYLLFLNSGDILFDSEVLEKFVNRGLNEDIYLGDYIIENILYRYNPQYEVLIRELLTNGFLHQSIFYKHSLFKNNRLYNENLKIVSDWLFNMESIILGDAKISTLGYVTTIFDPNGISSNKDEIIKEYKIIYSHMKGLEVLTNFYIKYHPLIEKIKKKKYILKLFRNILQIIKLI